jgi:DNA polymerase III delta prime subunit
VETPEDMRDLARSLTKLFETASRTLAESGPNELVQRVTAHLGCDISEVVPVTERFPVWEHVNVQRGVEAYLATQGSDGSWFGVSSVMRRPHEDLMSLITAPGPGGGARLGAASLGTAPIGPDENTEVIRLGLIAATAPGGAPVVIAIRSMQEFGPPFCFLDVLAADQQAAIAARDEIDRLIRAHDVFRGQVLSFSQSEHHGNELVSFLPRPSVTARDIVLPDGLLDAIERHIVGIADWSRDLLSAGQHLKRGLLLHGPPGTGKTHTVRYLTGRLTGSTVILLTGTSIRFIEQAAALARRLQPSVVVLEDVDLVGMDRDFSQNGNPLLFSLLEAMDGVGADADVTFVLTTNRADILEVALADRPGRVDLAMEIPRPDAACRERLLRLYARAVPLDADLSEVVADTDGVTASFVKELIRRTVLVSLRAGDSPPILRGTYFAEVLAEMNSEHHALTRSLLGSDAGDGQSRPDHIRRRYLHPGG